MGMTGLWIPFLRLRRWRRVTPAYAGAGLSQRQRLSRGVRRGGDGMSGERVGGEGFTGVWAPASAGVTGSWRVGEKG